LSGDPAFIGSACKTSPIEFAPPRWMSRRLNTVTGVLTLIGNRVPVTIISSITSSEGVVARVAVSAASAAGKSNAPTNDNVVEQEAKAG
jgi:hypothetical protein